MRSIKIPALALTLSFIMLVSAASAAYTVTIPGGSTTQSANGGTSGSEGLVFFNTFAVSGSNPLSQAGLDLLGVHHALGIDMSDLGVDSLGSNHFNNIQSDVYKDGLFQIGSSTGFLGLTLRNSIDDPVNFDNSLTEIVNVHAEVLDNQIGDASASYNTNGAKVATEHLDQDSALSVTLKGQLGAVVNKDTPVGVAKAEAGIYAKALQTDGDKYGGEAGLIAAVQNSGQGSVNAFVTNGEASFSSTDTDTHAYSIGLAKGNLNLQGENLQSGGTVGGYAEISSLTWISDRDTLTDPIEGITLVGKSSQKEILDLIAFRDVSFNGNSQITGSLAGSENGESVSYAKENQPRGHNLGETANRQIVDSESTSSMNAQATAFNQRDSSVVELEVNPEASLELNTVDWPAVGNVAAWTQKLYNAEAESYVDAYAQTERHVTSSPFKAVAEGYIDGFTWTSTALSRTNELATVTGAAGGTPDGLPADLKGFGVGAWILKTTETPVSAEVFYEQEASTNPESVTDKNLANTFYLDLNGMREDTFTSDAVGAFGAVKDQSSEVIIPSGSGSTSLTPGNLNAINWLEGGNSALFPGHWSPSTIIPSVDLINSVSRDVSLSWSA